MSAALPAGPRIAVVSTGLGHVQRGIEAWALATARGLAGDGTDAVLFSSGAVDAAPATVEVVPCLRRGSLPARLLTRAFRGVGGWRFGLGAPYQVEQATFAGPLVRRLRRGRFDVVHLQDPWLAWLLQRAGRRGRHGAQVLLAHGTEEPAGFLSRIQHVQELSPHYLLRHEALRLPPGFTRHYAPNFVDTHRFVPHDPSVRKALHASLVGPEPLRSRSACRRSLDIPDEAFVVLSVGAINRDRKRMDVLLREFSDAKLPDAVLVLAGACDEAGRALVDEVQRELGSRLHVLPNVPFDEMADVYGASDLFVLCSLEEIFGIAFLEAMASGIPCIGHAYPVTEWLIGSGGCCVDMRGVGTVAPALRSLRKDRSQWRSVASEARRRAVEEFSWDAVRPRFLEMYEQLAAQGELG